MSSDAAAEPRGGMEIQPHAVTPLNESRRSGGIVSLFSKWKPLKTPKVTASLTLYLLGLFVAFVARPPLTISDEMQTRWGCTS
jgi:hypothetical protein